MAEYIDKQNLYNIEKLLDTDVIRKSKTASWLLDQVLHDIKESPAVDVAQVVHGKWIFNDDWWEFRCTNCGKPIGNIKKYNFCPNCGAKMDGEADHE